MYFADSMKVDLDIAGNQTARRLGGGWGGGGGCWGGTRGLAAP